MNIYSFSMLNFSFGTLLTTILVLIKRRDKVAFRFFLFGMVVCGWGYLFSFMISQNYSQETTLFLSRLFYVFVVFIPITWLTFVFEFTQSKEPFRYFYLINYAIAFLCALACPTPLMFKGTHSISEFKYLPTPGLFHHLHTAQYITLVPIGFYALIRTYQRSVGDQREQLKYLILGTIIGFISATPIYLVYYQIPFPLYLFVLMPLYPIFMGIALIRYGLFDIQQIADAFQREKMAAIGVMAASLNHEIRNPLFVAKGKIETYLDAAERGAYGNPEQKQAKAEETIAVASQQLSRAVDIMQRFSDFARPANAKKFKERVIISEAIQDVLELVSNEFELKKIKVRQEVPDLELYIHKRQFEEILFNLILNSCHAIDKEHGELNIFANNGKSIKIEISDSGPGIPENCQKLIFEPFYSTKGEKGTGLGLYITKQLVERNNGKISVKSKLGRGATFILEFEK